MPASGLRAFLELSIDGAERAASIIRRHPCAWQAVSDGQARSSGSSSRPSGVIRRSPRKEKPAHAAIARYIISHNVYYVHMRLDRTGGLAPIHFSFASPQEASA